MAGTHLPIEASIPEIRRDLATKGLAVLTAPPGSGKTTVVPLHLLDDVGGRIVVLEPRRVATRAAARRMASLLGEEVGNTVGYVTRDDRRTGPGTRIEVVTEGVLTRRLQSDPELPGTGLVVFDEVHERNLQTDLGLALTLDVRSTIRPDLALLVMSATIDTDRLARLLDPDDVAPIIDVDAPTHPIDLRWTPAPRNARLEDHTAHIVHRAVDTCPGDVLVFLPGMGEIRRTADRLAETGLPAEVHLLHGSLPPETQDAALTPSPLRKVVLSTDIAESSLTVEGVSVVVDSGLARTPRFDARTGMTRLTTVSISKASADQRAGRAGRTGPGVVFRLWSKAEHAARPAHIQPEISQVDLAGLILELAAWGVSGPEALRFLDPPPSRAVDEARRLLRDLGAIDDGNRITAAGRVMTSLPLHPRLAHMVTAAGDDGWLACVVAALLDERDVIRGRPGEIPVDLALRARMVLDRHARHPRASGQSIQRVRRTAADLARRARLPRGDADPDHTGVVLALAYPDRLATRRGSPGRFQLRTGTTAWFDSGDPLATESFLVAADLDGKRKNARIRLAAALDPDEVARRFDREVTSKTDLVWVGERLVERTERRLGGITLDTVERRPHPGPATTDALEARLRSTDLSPLSWTKAVEALTERVTFLHRALGDPWPDWSRTNLGATVADWLGPYLTAATGLDDAARIDMMRVFRTALGPLVSQLDSLAPTHVTVPSGRRIAVDYSGDQPAIDVKVQEMFGATAAPTVGGRPVQLRLLSPADRPVQITSDLAGFWEGSWNEVRKEMAGRYPKHSWPDDPASAAPVVR